ncbi:helix-turn-helix domain-containing protein [Corynebacterium stationis]
MSTGAGVSPKNRSGVSQGFHGTIRFSSTVSFGLPRMEYFPTLTTGTNGLWAELDSLALVSAKPETQSASSQISELRELSGLTINQLGRLFGVSRRSVHNWLNGKPMAARHEERAGDILSQVRALPGQTPSEKRAELLASRDGGSIFHRLRGGADENATLQINAISPRDQMQL